MVKEQTLPLVIDLNVYRGYGSIEIDYCENLTSYSFENVGGESG